MTERDKLLAVFDKEIVPVFKDFFVYFKSGVKGVSFAQLHLLKMIEKNPLITVKEVAGLSHITTAAISQTINNLIEEKYIIKQQSKEDKRVYFLQITEKGIDVLEENRNFRKDMLKKILSPLNDSEFKDLISIFARIKEGFKER
ncbi:MAG: MarR family transcriptional regulator [Spirochaetes bacterium]|nr:MarR family transcriptional regulator [Spirochaetota bacterium]